MLERAKSLPREPSGVVDREDDNSPTSARDRSSGSPVRERGAGAQGSSSATSGSGVPGGGERSPSPSKKQNAMKGRSIEGWLNHALGQASDRKLDAAAADANATSGQMQGLSNFGIDTGALERLGLDAKASERVYRAMFVYSQGLHAVLQEAVGRSRNPSQALLVLWRAFMTVLEHAGQNEQHGAESLVALVQRGNADEQARLEAQYKEQLVSLQAQTQKLTGERRGLQEEVQRFREDEMRLRNESEMYRNEHQVAVSKYEREIKQRVDAEVRFLEKARWCDALQEDLNKERKQNMAIEGLLREANEAREKLQIELDSLRIQVKLQDEQAGAYKQSVLEAAQQRQRHDQQVGQYKASIERMTAKINELKEQLDAEIEYGKQLTDQNTNQQREIRKLETSMVDEAHARRELQGERDLLREKLERSDKDMSDLTQERRAMQKEINDLSMSNRTNQIELKRRIEQLERTDRNHEKLQVAHRELVEAHRALSIEAESLRADASHMDEQLKKESELRKQLQAEKKQLTGQLQTVTIERDTAQLAVQGTQKELQEVTDKMVKLESIVRDTKSAMQKMTLEHQVETKAHAQKVAMLEKVIADERKERRNLVNETTELDSLRQDALNQIKKKDLEIQDLKRQRLEKEEAMDRYKILLKAQEQRNMEQMVTVDKYHDTVASHEAEMRQMQVLLECEREEAKRQLYELQTACAASTHVLEKRIEEWKMSFEDALSQLNFNSVTQRLQLAEEELEVVKEQLAIALEKVRDRDQALKSGNSKAAELLQEKNQLEKQLQEWIAKYTQAAHLLEQQSLARADEEAKYARYKKKVEAFESMNQADREAFEKRIAELLAEIEDLKISMEVTTADAETQVYVQVAEDECQTDLSYQYLESTEDMQVHRWRRARLDALKRASVFVADPEEQRDFTVGASQKAPVVSIGDDVQDSTVVGTFFKARKTTIASTTQPKDRRMTVPAHLAQANTSVESGVQVSRVVTASTGGGSGRRK